MGEGQNERGDVGITQPHVCEVAAELRWRQEGVRPRQPVQDGVEVAKVSAYALVQAGWIAAGLWILGMGSRMAFELWSEHGGAPSIAHFSAAHARLASEDSAN